jgi:type II secretory pathway pseudopilin PulG
MVGQRDEKLNMIALEFHTRKKINPGHADRRDCGSGRRRDAQGFTFLGVMFLVILMGLAVTVASEAWYMSLRREKEEELLFAGDQMRRAIASFTASVPGAAQRYPGSLQELIRDPRLPGVKRHLRKIYQDPMTGKTEWGLIRSSEGAITGVHSLSDREPIKKSGFSRDDRDFEGKTQYSKWVFVPKTAQGARR